MRESFEVWRWLTCGEQRCFGVCFLSLSERLHLHQTTEITKNREALSGVEVSRKETDKKQPCLASLSQTAGRKMWAWGVLARASSRAVSSGFKVHRCGHRLRATSQKCRTSLSTHLLTWPVWVGQGFTPVPIITSAHRWGAFNLDLIPTCVWLHKHILSPSVSQKLKYKCTKYCRVNLMFVKSCLRCFQIHTNAHLPLNQNLKLYPCLAYRNKLSINVFFCL